MSARADLCGGRSEMIVPTATSLSFVQAQHFRVAPESQAIQKLSPVASNGGFAILTGASAPRLLRR
jgi:hypothetical protein